MPIMTGDSKKGKKQPSIDHFYGAAQTPSPAMCKVLLELLGVKIKEYHEWEQMAMFPNLHERQNRTNSEYRELNSFRSIPVIQIGDFKLTECEAIMRFCARKFAGENSHWYPSDDLEKCAVIDAFLSQNLCAIRPSWQAVFSGQSIYGVNEGPLKGRPNGLVPILYHVAHTYLPKEGKFIGGFDEPSIADLCAACEVYNLQFWPVNLGGPWKAWCELIDDYLKDNETFQAYKQGSQAMGATIGQLLGLPKAPEDPDWPYDWSAPWGNALKEENDEFLAATLNADKKGKKGKKDKKEKSEEEEEPAKTKKGKKGNQTPVKEKKGKKEDETPTTKGKKDKKEKKEEEEEEKPAKAKKEKKEKSVEEAKPAKAQKEKKEKKEPGKGKKEKGGKGKKSPKGKKGKK